MFRSFLKHRSSTSLLSDELLAGCSEEDATMVSPPQETSSTKAPPSWPRGMHFEVKQKSDAAHPGWMSVSGWARMDSGLVELDWDVLDSVGKSTGTLFQFEPPQPGKSDSIRLTEVALVPDPMAPEGRYRLVISVHSRTDSMITDTIPFQLDFPPIFGVGLKLDRDTVTATSGYSYVEDDSARIWYAIFRESQSALRVMENRRRIHRLAPTWVSDPMPGWPIDRDYGFKPTGSATRGNYRFRITIWNATGDTIRPEFPFVVVKPPRRFARSSSRQENPLRTRSGRGAGVQHGQATMH
ncbi:MAG: hypothetical protein IPN71_16285 [Fibrobacteres bacterium]|nr:hypothetical protein [Fibrobacterota bacterium]